MTKEASSVVLVVLVVLLIVVLVVVAGETLITTTMLYPHCRLVLRTPTACEVCFLGFIDGLAKSHEVLGCSDHVRRPIGVMWYY